MPRVTGTIMPERRRFLQSKVL